MSTDTDVRRTLAPGRQATPTTAAAGHEGVPWSHVLPLAVVFAYVDGFWVVALRGAVGPIERTDAPFSAWLQEATLLLPVYVLAIVAAMGLLARRFGPVPSGLRAVATAILGLVAAGTVAGAAFLVATTVYDYQLEIRGLNHMIALHGGCDAACVADRVQATKELQLKSVGVGIVLMAVSNRVMAGLVVASRGGALAVATRRPARELRIPDVRLVLAAGLVGTAVIHAAVVPEHVAEWPAAGVFFVVLTMVEVGTAAVVLTTRLAGLVLVGTAVVSAGPLVVWAVSRTVGLPFGPEPGAAEGVAVVDCMACALELLALVLAVALLVSRRLATRWSRHTLAVALTGVVAVTVIGIGGSGAVGVFAPVAPAHSHAAAGEG